MAHDPITQAPADIDPEARTGNIESSQAGGISMSWDAIRGIAAALSAALSAAPGKFWPHRETS